MQRHLSKFQFACASLDASNCCVFPKPFDTINRHRRPILHVSSVLGTQQDRTEVDRPAKPDGLTKRSQVGSQSHVRKTSKPRQAFELFPDRHVGAADPLFYAYYPFGCLIACVRMAVWLSLLLLDQAWLTDNDVSIRVLQAILGVRVAWENLELLPSGRQVIVSNHVTTGDMMALYRLPVRTVHLISSQLPDRIATSKHHRIDFKHASVESYDRLKDETDPVPIHLFPEGGMTNGMGMMKFNKGFMRFTEALPVVPVALRARLPWKISTHTLNSSFFSNLFWFCFSPYVDLQMNVLTPLRQKEAESKAAFIERIQASIADELDVPIFDFTLQAKKQLMRAKKGQAH